MQARDDMGNSLGFAFVRLPTATKAQLARDKVRALIFHGKPLVCKWLGEISTAGSGGKSAEESPEAPTPLSQSPIEKSDSPRTNVDVEVEPTHKTDENT
jgi:RNA recognition motif-containing protein